MFKTLKDTKRRMVESVLEGVGKSEKTVDEEFEMYYAKYQSMMNDLNECGAGLHTVLTRQKEFFRDLSEMANSLSRVNQTNNDPEYWKGSTNCLTAVEGAELNKESAEYIHNVVRSSCALSVVENALDPLRDAIATITPEIDGLVKDRNAQVIDYDSYRRRVKTIREKKESMETQGKTGTPGYAETQQELAKFEGKEQVAKEGYEFKNGNTKEKILDARVRHDVLLNDLLVNLVVAQHEMYSRAAAEMERVISRLPEDKVAEARARITDTIKKGGNKPEAPKEKSALSKGLAIVTGKAVPSDFKKATPADAEIAKSPSNAASPPVAVPIGGASSGAALPTATKVGGTTATSPVKSSSNPFGGSSPAPPAGRPAGAIPPPPPAAAVPPPPPASAVPPPPSSAKTYFVEALYDIDAEAEDELTFKAGDSIEVLETSDDGWWKGRINGKEGLFPVNYVRT